MGGGFFQCLWGASRQDQQMARTRMLASLSRRRFLQNDMGIGAADAEGAYAGAARTGSLLPGSKLCIDVERAVGKNRGSGLGVSQPTAGGSCL